MSKPKIVIASGDPNGIGPEIAIKILNAKGLAAQYDIKVIIPSSVIEHYCHSLNLPVPDKKKIIDIPDLKIRVKEGRIDKKAGQVAAESIRIGVELCLRRNFDALVTLPISKKSFNLAGFDFPGHTEYLKALTGCERTIMIMYSKQLVITPVTIHIPLRKVTSELEKSVLKSNLLLLHKTLLNNFKVKSPKIAVLAINPHAGDGGLHGSEEKTKLEPVIKELRSEGIDVKGPFPADGFFGNVTYKDFDAVAGAYHDQALIPFKILSEGHGVNYTAGLPIIRTSPTHGTAFDIAGKNMAKIESTIEAIKLAAKLISK
ncbi:MAG: 4-hydroxythreonine-4-phosphate dehydrogenase PdxA [Ignavibacteriota bacterium]|nr:4-hydroxythreonine-4-phosphate dehydrogenase PdxA [Ignavibacteriota bacterium]